MLMYKLKCVTLLYVASIVSQLNSNNIIFLNIYLSMLLGYEPAGLTVHPPPPNDRGWVHFFRIGV